MISSHVLIHLAGGALALAVISATAARAADGKLRADLQAISQRTVFFGHQSVGGNVLDGLRDLSAESGVPLRIAEVSAGARLAAGTFGHGLIPQNGDPLQKLQSFERAFSSGAAAGAQIALMKFCYVDFSPGTDVPALFARYRSTLEDLRKRHPRTAFVHVTVPLVAEQVGLKAFAKRLLGRESAEALNARREEFNALLRQAYQGKEPVFDLARVESTDPAGRTVTATSNGRPVPVLVGAYTDDGGHLNAEGRRRAARALVEVLAALPASQSTVASERR
jgi:hypothetical protein